MTPKSQNRTQSSDAPWCAAIGGASMARRVRAGICTRCVLRAVLISCRPTTGTDDLGANPRSATQGGNAGIIREPFPDHRAREDFHAHRHPRLSRQGRADHGKAQGLTSDRRRRPCQRNRVLVRDHRSHRQRGAALHREIVPRPRRLPARLVERQRSALPGRRRPHYAPAEAGRADPAPGCTVRCSSRSAPWMRSGIDYMVVFPDSDALARHAPAGRRRGRARQRL